MNTSGCGRKYSTSEVLPDFAAPTRKKFGSGTPRSGASVTPATDFASTSASSSAGLILQPFRHALTDRTPALVSRS
jgi:hypothetical protein